MKKLLILAHPNIQDSRINSKLKEEILSSNAVDVIREIYKEYPDFKIDIAKEQKLLNKHDLIIFQHPLYWYTMPPLLHHYINEVMAFGYAYGPGGGKLHGKKWLSVFTTGSHWSAYRSGAHNNFTFSELAKPLEQTAKFCKMEWQPLVAITGAHNDGTGKPISDKSLNKEAEDYIKLLNSY